MTIKLLKEHSLFLFILACCAVLRFIPLFDYQFTLDELSGLNRTRFDSFHDLVEKGIKIDAHPAFVQILIFLLVKCFGFVNWVIKLPFVLMSLGTVLFAYLFCTRNFTKQAGVFSAIFFSFSLIFVFYAPIARMYSAGVFFSMALLYYFFEIVFQNSTSAKHFFLFGLFALLSAVNHHINALFALSVCVSGLLFLKKNNWRPYLITCALTVLCYLPNMPVTLYQLGIGGIGFEQNGWLPVPEAGAVFKFLKIIFGTGRAWLLLLFLLLLSFVLQRRIFLSKKQVYLLLLFVFNYLVIYLYSVLRAPVYQYSVMMFAAVAILLFACSLLQFENKLVFSAAAGLLLLLLVYKTYIKKDYLHQCVETVFEYQFKRTAHYKAVYGEKNVFPVFFDADEFMEELYFKKYAAFDCRISGDADISTTKSFSQFVAALQTDYLVLSSAMPAQQAIAAQYFPYLIENTQTQANNFKLYSKKNSDKDKVVEDDKILLVSNLYKPGPFVYNYSKAIHKSGHAFSLEIDSLIEFPFEARAKYADVVGSEGQVLLVKTAFSLISGKATSLASCISVDDLTKKQNYAYNSKDSGDFVPDPDSTLRVYVDNFFGTNHEKIKDRSNLAVYIWNRNKEHAVLTDFEIRLVDFWPRKWQLWD